MIEVSSCCTSREVAKDTGPGRLTASEEVAGAGVPAGGVLRGRGTCLHFPDARVAVPVPLCLSLQQQQQLNLRLNDAGRCFFDAQASFET